MTKLAFGTGCDAQSESKNERYCTHIANSEERPLCNYNNCPITFVSSSFENNMNIYQASRSCVNRHIWAIFERYTQEFNLNYGNPKAWEIWPKFIRFVGRGDDSISVDISLKFFTDTENAFAEKHHQILEHIRLRTDITRRSSIQSDYELYQTLKKQFESEDYVL